MATSSERLEREAEQSRERLAAKLEALRAQITPGHLFDQVTDYARQSGGAELVRNLGRQVRDNPLPLTLMSAALAWLMMGNRSSSAGTGAIGRAVENLGESARDLTGRFNAGHGSDDIADAFRDHLTGVQPPTQKGAEALRESAAAAASRMTEAGGRARARLSEIGDQTASAAASVGATASSAYRRAGDYASGMAQGVSDRATSLAESTSAASRSLADFCAEQPLVLAGIGLALGAGLGAVLPSTTVENRLMGESSEELKRKGQEVASDAWDQAKSAAQSGYGAAKTEAERQGVPWREAEETALAPKG